MSDSENLDQLEQQQEQSEEQPDDPIVLLCNRLGAIEAALGVGICEASPSSLMNRLGAIETSLSKDQRERNLPPTITRSQVASLSFMRKSGILLEDISSGKVRIVADEEG